MQRTLLIILYLSEQKTLKNPELVSIVWHKFNKNVCAPFCGSFFFIRQDQYDLTINVESLAPLMIVKLLYKPLVCKGIKKIIFL